MSVEFEEQKLFSGGPSIYQKQPNVSWISKFVINRHWAKNYKDASFILFLFSIVFFALTIFVVYYSFYYKPTPPAPTARQKAIEEYRKKGLRGVELFNRVKLDVAAGKY